MESIDIFLRNAAGPLQYVAFFGALILFGLLELFVRRSRTQPQRRQRWPANFVLTTLNILILGAIPVSALVVADFASRDGIGLFNKIQITPMMLLLAGFLLRSLISWATHLAMHKIPLFWRIHRVHHTDTEMDISTTVRFHPLEFLISTPIVLVTILAAGISPVSVLVYELFDAAMAVFTHSNIRTKPGLEKVLRLALVTPDMHRVHHSTCPVETDSNYGATLSIWDRIFGTLRLRDSSALATMQLGLVEYRDHRSNSPGWLLLLPFRSSHVPPVVRPSDVQTGLNINEGELI